MMILQIYKGCRDGWQPLGPCSRPLSPDRAARVLALAQRIKGQEWLIRATPEASHG